MAAGFASTFRMGPLAYAERLAEAGYCVLAFDHRGFGVSDGEPRQQVCFWTQLDGYRDAISFLLAQPSVDPARIAVWGISFSGGVALAVGAVDERVAAVLAVTPALLGSVAAVSPGQAAFDAFQGVALGRAHRNAGLQRSTGPLPVVPMAGEPASECWFGDGEDGLPLVAGSEGAGRRSAKEYYRQGSEQDVSWKNRATWVVPRTGCSATAAVPVHFLRRAAVHMALAGGDELVTPASVRRGFAVVPSERKQLLEIAGGHFEPLQGHMPRDGDHPEFEQIASAQVEFLRRHLGFQ